MTKKVTFIRRSVKAKYPIDFTEESDSLIFDAVRSSSEKFAVRMMQDEPIRMRVMAGMSYLQTTTSFKNTMAINTCIRIAKAALNESKTMSA